ncbi:MAG: MarR family transcriptional regulator [Alphaproteobacteria bacterium]|nr:MAG: MarR family transcriptional regulator [Alphaproteobacteria bacterium]
MSRIETARLAEALQAAAIRLTRRLRQGESGGALTGPEASALAVIANHDGISIGALAAAEQVRPPSMSRVVNILVAKGLVRRHDDPSDGRRQLLSLTAKGKKAQASSPRRRQLKALADALAALSDRDRNAIARAVAALDRLQI